MGDSEAMLPVSNRASEDAQVLSQVHDIFGTLLKLIRDQNNEIQRMGSHIGKLEGQLKYILESLHPAAPEPTATTLNQLPVPGAEPAQLKVTFQELFTDVDAAAISSIDDFSRHLFNKSMRALGSGDMSPSSALVSALAISTATSPRVTDAQQPEEAVIGDRSKEEYVLSSRGNSVGVDVDVDVNDLSKERVLFSGENDSDVAITRPTVQQTPRNDPNNTLTQSVRQTSIDSTVDPEQEDPTVLPSADLSVSDVIEKHPTSASVEKQNLALDHTSSSDGSQNAQVEENDKLKSLLIGTQSSDQMVAAQAEKNLNDLLLEYLNRLAEQSSSQQRALKKSKKAKNSREMSAGNLVLIPPERRQKVIVELRKRGAFIKETREYNKGLLQQEQDAKKNIGVRIAAAEQQIKELSAKSEAQKRFIDRIPIGLRKILPDDFGLHYQFLKEWMSAVGDLGGLNGLLAQLRRLPDLIELANNPMEVEREAIPVETLKPESAGNTSEPAQIVQPLQLVNGKLPQEITSAVQSHLNEMELDPEAKTFRRIQDMIDEIKYNRITRRDLDDLFFFGEGNLRATDPHAIKLKAAVSDLCKQVIKEEGGGGNRESGNKGDNKDAVDRAYVETVADLFASNAARKTGDDLRQEIVGLKLLIDQKLRSVENASEAVVTDMSEIKFDMRSAMDSIGTMSADIAEIRFTKKTSGGGGLDEAALNKIQSELIKQQNQQKSLFTELSDVLDKLQKDVEGKPGQEELARIIEDTKQGFGRQLGSNITGMKQAVGTIVKVVKEKATMGDVEGLIKSRVATLEGLLSGVIEENNSSMAASYKCLSCGSSAMSRRRPMGGGPEQEHYSGPMRYFDDDVDSLGDSSVGSLEGGSPGSRGGNYRGRGGNDELVAYLNDLRNKHPESRGGAAPLSPVEPPANHRYLKKNTGAVANPTPLYLRARNASYLKETIKIPIQIPTASSKSNLYIMEGALPPGSAHVGSRSTTALPIGTFSYRDKPL